MLKANFTKFLIVAVLAAATAYFMSSRIHSSPFLDRSENLKLEEIPGITKDTLSKKNETYRIAEPISFYRENNLAIFDVEILSPGFGERNITFTGDAERFNGFVAEIDFVQNNSGRFKVGQVGSGAVDGVTSLVTGLWGLVRHPIDSVKGIANGGKELAVYLYNAAAGNADPGNDISNLAHAVYINTVSEIASDAHFSYQEAITAESRKTADAMANWKLSGRGVTEIALLLVPISKLTALKTSAEVAEIAKGATTLEKVEEVGEAAKGYENIVKGGTLFSEGGKILKSLRRLAGFASAESTIAEQIIRPLSDPVKLASLGVRGANPRVHKLLYHLYVLEKNGGNVELALERALVPGIKGEFYYSQPLVKQRILLNYKSAKELGLFDNASNLEAMRRGIAPIIQRGPHAGDIVHVDHIIPLKHAPELGNNLANLRYLPEAENLSRSASMDEDAIKLSEQMRNAGWQPTSEVANLITK